MKRRLINAVCILLLLSSAVFLLMPHVSREITKKDMDDKISRFETAVSNTETLPDEDDETASDSQNSPSGEVYSEEGVTMPINVNKLYEDSKAYNKALADHQDMGKGFTDSVLYLPDYGIYDGMYGYISCSAIGLYLPIYLGATDENMSYGTAHMSNTSLPTGGENTHCVLVGHTGYFGRTFFDNIRNLEKGDALTIKTYFNTLTYEVVSYKEIGPTDTNDLFIQNKKDMLTLVTCSQWGTRRYMVQCERII